MNNTYYIERSIIASELNSETTIELNPSYFNDMFHRKLINGINRLKTLGEYIDLEILRNKYISANKWEFYEDNQLIDIMTNTTPFSSQEILIKYSKGDVRKLENFMQAATSISKEITINILNEIIDTVNPKEVEELVDVALRGDLFKAREMLLKLKIYRGYTGLEILKEIYNIILKKDLNSKFKIKIVDKIATIEFRIVEGSDDEIQLESLITLLSSIKNL